MAYLSSYPVFALPEDFQIRVSDSRLGISTNNERKWNIHVPKSQKWNIHVPKSQKLGCRQPETNQILKIEDVAIV